MIKQAFLTALLALPTAAQAHISCAGETNGTPTIVKVEIDTQGTMGAVAGGRVTISPKDAPVRAYDLNRAEIAQFFESVDGPNDDRAIVGLAAFVSSENPVYIRFVGPNETRDLTVALRDDARKKRDEAMKKSGRNALRVWKGPGYAADQQHSFKDVVCSVTLDP